MAFSLGGGDGIPTVKFDNVGDSVTGTVIDVSERQSTKMGTTDPDFWPDGSKKLYYRVVLQTSLRADVDDDGQRAVALTGSRKPEEQASLGVVLAAIELAGGKKGEIDPGATMTLTYIGSAPPKTTGFNPRKLFSASYVRPTMNIGATPAPQTVTVTAGTPIVPVPASTHPAAQQYSRDQIASFLSANVNVAALGITPEYLVSIGLA